MKQDEKTIGGYMYNYMKSNEMSVDNKTKKLTQLLTVDQFSIFTSYYLWWLIDRCNFQITEIKSFVTYSSHDMFNPFVTEMMNRRQQLNQETKVKISSTKSS